MLLGSSVDDEKSAKMLSPTKLIEMSSGFASYTASTVDVDVDKGSRAAQEELVNIVLSEESNAIQEILIDGFAQITDAVVREGISAVRQTTPVQNLESLMKFTVENTEKFTPAPLKPIIQPLTLPYYISQAIFTLSQKSREDEKSLQILNSVSSLISSNRKNKSANNENQAGSLGIPLPSLESVEELTSQLVDSNSSLRKLIQDPNVQSKFPVLLALSRKYGQALFTRAADRIDRVVVPHKATNGNLGNSDVLSSVGTIASQSAKQIAKLLSTGPETN